MSIMVSMVTLPTVVLLTMQKLLNVKIMIEGECGKPVFF